MAKNIHSMGHIRIDFPIKIGAVLLTLSTVAIIGFSLAKTERTKGIYVFGTAVGTAAATGISAFYLLQSILESTAVSKEGQAQALACHREISQRAFTLQQEEAQSIVTNRTLDYIARWNSREYSVARKIGKEVHELFSESFAKEHNEILREYLKQAPNKKLEVAFVLNFFEELAIVRKNSLIDEKLAKDFFKSIVVAYYEMFESFVLDARREKGNDNLYRHLSDLAVAWKNGDGNNHS